MSETPRNPPDPATRLAELRQQHIKGWRSTSDEVWDRPGICLGCGDGWPCDTADALDAMDALAAAGGATGEPPADAEPSDLDGGVHSLWLHASKWDWLLTKMTTPERAAIEAAVARYSAALNASDSLAASRVAPLPDTAAPPHGDTKGMQS